MRHRHAVAVDRVVPGIARGLPGAMGDDLVAVEIEVDPLVRRSPFWAAHHPTPEGAGFFEIADGEGQVEGAQGHVRSDSTGQN